MLMGVHSDVRIINGRLRRHARFVKTRGARDRTGRFAELRAGALGAGGGGPAAEAGAASPLEAAGQALSRARDRCQSAVRQLACVRAQLEGERDRSRCFAEQRAHVRRPPARPPCFAAIPVARLPGCPPAHEPPHRPAGAPSRWIKLTRRPYPPPPSPTPRPTWPST